MVDENRLFRFLMSTQKKAMDELIASADLARGRIYRRVLERCFSIRGSDQNIRDLNQVEVFDRAIQLLGDA